VLSITGTFDPYNDRVVEDTVQDGTRRDRIPKELRPVMFFYVGCKDQRLIILVALVDHLEKQMRFLNYL